jgi:hypothetical protein
MSELSIEVSDLQPCPTCAAVVRRQDMDEHQRWHASTTADTSTPGTARSGSDTGQRPPGD